MRSIYLFDNQLKEIDLTGLSELEKINIYSNAKDTRIIGDPNLEKAKVINLPMMDITDISMVTFPESLYNLDLAGNLIADISPLSNLEQVDSRLALEDNKITDISSLSNLVSHNSLKIHALFEDDRPPFG